LAHALRAHEQWQPAERLYREIVEQLPNTDAAAEALYWAGVAKYKGSGDASALGETAKAFKNSYQQSSWAKKASVWAA
jgi:outer membrane protein assembly factor BamD (BamD/ComL family)